MDDSTFVFIVIAIAALLFASDRVRMDFVAIVVVLALVLGNILSPQEALAGFGDPIVVLVAGLMVVGEALERTGVAQSLGMLVSRVGGVSRPRITALIMASSAALSGFMSSTAVVAIFIPISLKIAKETGINATRLLLPMSYAAMISGTLTLIATMPNLVISDALVESGNDPLTFFGFAPVGLCIFAFSTGFMILIGDRVLRQKETESEHAPSRPIHQLLEEFDLPPILDAVRINTDSSLCGQSIAESNLGRDFGIRILAIYSADDHAKLSDVREPNPDYRFRPGDILVLAGEESAILRFSQMRGLRKVKRTTNQLRRTFQERGVGLIMIHPNSRYVGKTIRDIGLRSRYGVHVIGMQRSRERVQEYTETPLQIADVLLVAGAWKRIAAIGNERQDFVLLELPSEHAEARPAFRRAPIALIALLAMVLASMFNLLPISIAVLLAAVSVIVFGCLKATDAYRAISWSSLVLLGGMLPIATAMAKTGATEKLSHAVVSSIGMAGPYAMISLLFILASSLSLVLSNTATAVVLAPVAIKIASALEVSPYPLAVTVLIGASSAFASPVASPVVTLVVEPGHYSFRDFLRLGIPLMVIAFIVNLVVTPILYPL